jgi:hypothetical protein
MTTGRINQVTMVQKTGRVQKKKGKKKKEEETLWGVSRSFLPSFPTHTSVPTQCTAQGQHKAFDFLG